MRNKVCGPEECLHDGLTERGMRNKICGPGMKNKV